MRRIFHHGYLWSLDGMTGFSFDKAVAVCDGVELTSIARREGTPLYVYSAELIRERYAALDAAFGAHPHRVHYALKANSTLGLVRIIHAAGGAVDANSGGEIAVALRAGVQPKDIVFTGVGKTEAELDLAVRLGVQVINAESQGELDRIDRLAVARGMRARVALRINPDVDAESHPGISTGHRSHKFGVPLECARDICRQATARDGLSLVGLHAHIGSQITSLEPVRRTAAMVADLAQELRDDGVTLDHLDLGGGLGISYDGTPVLDVVDYASALLDVVAPTGLMVLVEPGRWIVGPAAVLLATVVDVKRQDSDRYFVVLDTGMSDLIRPELYGAYHRIEALVGRNAPVVTCDVVGPICETTDVIGMERRLVLPAVGDVLGVRDAGAYGSAMASNYNRHPLPIEVLVDAGVWKVIRRRQSIDDQLSLES